MNKPHIICHMVTSIDGKVTGSFLRSEACKDAAESYYQINRDYYADAFACGRITMAESFTGGFQPDLTPFSGAKISREDYIAEERESYYAVAFDRRGNLGWTASHISDEDPGYDNAHIIEVLCEDAGSAYLAYLRSIGVSYIFAGKDEMDIPLALDKLYRLFGIRLLLLEGGSVINGAFARADVIDELSLVAAPVVADAESKPLFAESVMKEYHLKEAKVLSGSAVWLHYVK
ncbi:MAG: dihydrofolate reductase family protein [Ruminococcus sp.]|nr:dihydrofolate reductase family protein [Ruminococcus sp.]